MDVGVTKVDSCEFQECGSRGTTKSLCMAAVERCDDAD